MKIYMTTVDLDNYQVPLVEAFVNKEDAIAHAKSVSEDLGYVIKHHHESLGLHFLSLGASASGSVSIVDQEI